MEPVIQSGALIVLDWMAETKVDDIVVTRIGNLFMVNKLRIEKDGTLWLLPENGPEGALTAHFQKRPLRNHFWKKKFQNTTILLRSATFSFTEIRQFSHAFLRFLAASEAYLHIHSISKWDKR